VIGSIIPSISPASCGLSGVPQGAVYTVPITVRNSYPTARTITAVTTDFADYAVSGLVGTNLAPGQRAYGLVTFHAAALGSRLAAIDVAFDIGPGNTARFQADVVAPTFSVTTEDDMPTDGRLDFGTHKAGSGPFERTVTFTNLDAADLPVAGCTAMFAPFELVSECPTTIPANSSVALTVRFTPMGAGDALDSLQLILERGYTGILLSARAIARQLAFSATSLDFPTTYRDAVAERAVTITNLSTAPVTVPVAVTGMGFSIDRTSVTIPGGTTADVVVQFQPPAPGAFTGSLELGASGDPEHASVLLSGQGASMPGTDDPPVEEPRPHSGGCDASGAGGIGAAWMVVLAIVRRRRCPA
jgi:uncharacterized protein (TIGR03382 family)